MEKTTGGQESISITDYQGPSKPTRVIDNINEVKAYTKDQIDLIKKTVAVGATDDELKMFIAVCQKAGLDPFARQVHFIKRGGKATIQTGIDWFRAIAERTGQYAGNDEYLYNGNLTEYECLKDGLKTPTTAKAVVRKIVQGSACEFSAVASWIEYCPQGGEAFMWKKMPYLMLGKCAEALALRKPFPNDMSGLYTNDEMDQADRPDVKKLSEKKSATIIEEVKKSKVKEKPKKVPEKDETTGLLKTIDKLLKNVDLDQDKKEKTGEWLEKCTPTSDVLSKTITKMEKNIEENHTKRTEKEGEDDDLPF